MAKRLRGGARGEGAGVVAPLSPFLVRRRRLVGGRVGALLDREREEAVRVGGQKDPGRDRGVEEEGEGVLERGRPQLRDAREDNRGFPRGVRGWALTPILSAEAFIKGGAHLES